jgi:hypothetical protein
MADIVVFKVDASITEEERRKLGMRKLGQVFNQYFMDASLTADEKVNETIQEIIDDTDFIATYLDPANILSIKNRQKGTYYFKPGDPSAVLKLRGMQDKKDKVDGEDVDVMHIAISGGNGDLLAAGNYLTKVISDLGVANPTTGKQKYLLGTITFRRCR